MMSSKILSDSTVIIIRKFRDLAFQHLRIDRAFVGKQVVDVQHIDIADLLHRVRVLRFELGVSLRVRTAHNAEWIEVALFSVEAESHLEVMNVVFLGSFNSFKSILEPGVS